MVKASCVGFVRVCVVGVLATGCVPASQDITKGVIDWHAPPIAVPDGTRYAPNVAYGPYGDGGSSSQLMDLFVPAGRQPVPIVLFVHGGGFVGGDKAKAYSAPAEIAAYLERGIAYGTVNYRLLADQDQDGVLKPLKDVARAVQFVRAHAGLLGLDGTVVLHGSSAGAGASLWLATHDDLARPESEDVVLRESTRVTAVALSETQATYNIPRWETDVFVDYPDAALGFDEMAPALQQRMLSFYGVRDVAALDTPEIQAYMADVDMLALMDTADAPIWVENVKQDVVSPDTTGLLFHHAHHARTIEAFATAAGLSVVAGYGNADARMTRETFTLEMLAE